MVELVDTAGLGAIRQGLGSEMELLPNRWLLAVLPSQAAVDRVIERLTMQRRWEFHGSVYDYVATPKPDGYRAKHLVVVKDGALIEVQLRTEAQHRWAELVERFDREHGLGLKSGRAAP